MNIDFFIVRKIYGEDVLSACSENIDDLVVNLSYLNSLGFSDLADVVEHYPLIFLMNSKEFKTKVDKLILEVGNIDEFAYNMNLWEELL